MFLLALGGAGFGCAPKVVERALPAVVESPAVAVAAIAPPAVALPVVEVVAPEPVSGATFVGPEAPRSTIAAALNAKAPSFQQCVDAAVLHGEVGGQLSIGWVVVAGVVGSVHVVKDSTGNSAVAGCFSNVISALQFPPTLTAQVAAYPWSFATE